MSKFSFLQIFAISLALVNQGQYSESKKAGSAIGTVIGPIGQIDVIGVTPSNQATDFETNLESGDYIVSSIAIKTGNGTNAGTDAAAELKICDQFRNCCKTKGLDNPGNDRESGQLDEYENEKLGTCAQGVIILTPYIPWCKVDIKDQSEKPCP